MLQPITRNVFANWLFCGNRCESIIRRRLCYPTKNSKLRFNARLQLRCICLLIFNFYLLGLMDLGFG